MAEWPIASVSKAEVPAMVPGVQIPPLPFNMRGVMSKDPWRDFLALILQIKTKDELSAFCDLFLTIEEKETLASRFLIVKALLDEKLTQREISEKFKVSIAQITRGSNALKIIDPKLKAHLVKILSE